MPFHDLKIHINAEVFTPSSSMELHVLLELSRSKEIDGRETMAIWITCFDEVAPGSFQIIRHSNIR
jgi:hypothetical protein